MLLSERDIAALRLLFWCQYISPKDMNSIFSEAELINLAAAGFLKTHRKSGAFVLAKNGTKLLPQIFHSSFTFVTQSYHKRAIQRRLHLSKLIITAYRAGINVFTETPEDLSTPSSLFLSSITRCRGTDPWGSTRIAALMHLGDLICGCYYLYPGAGKLSLTDELTVFNNQTSYIKGSRRAIIFAGESYQTILDSLEPSTPKADSKLLTYGDAYRCLTLPIHLVACDDTGAIQLQLMAVPDYRQRLTQAALKSQYQPPPKEIPSWDALFDNIPFVMAADMDLHRVDTALKAAQVAGYAQTILACLEEQAKTVFAPRYCGDGEVRLFGLKQETLTQVLRHPPGFYAPPRTQYKSIEGDVIDVPLIQITDKTGKACRKAGRHHSS